jgi:hypothetical protein
MSKVEAIKAELEAIRRLTYSIERQLEEYTHSCLDYASELEVIRQDMLALGATMATHCHPTITHGESASCPDPESELEAIRQDMLLLVALASTHCHPVSPQLPDSVQPEVASSETKSALPQGKQLSLRPGCGALRLRRTALCANRKTLFVAKPVRRARNGRCAHCPLICQKGM